MSGWGCPHEVGNKCTLIKNLPCDPGMKGCVLHGKVTFADPAKNRPTPKKEKKTPRPQNGD